MRIQSSYWLVLDIGNTHTVAALYSGDTKILKTTEPAARVRFRTASQATADEYRMQLEQLFGGDGFWKSVERVIVSTVVPSLETAVIAACHPRPCLSINHSAIRDFDLAIPVPESLGADRLANLAAAMALFKPPFMIVDAGTATKFCLVDSQARYIGGAISPGFEISWKALQAHAAKLFWVKLQHPSSSVGNTTDSQLCSGVLLGYESMIEGMTNRLLADAQWSSTFASPTLISTGGCMHSLKLSERYSLIPDLTLLGLMRYGQLNS